MSGAHITRAPAFLRICSESTHRVPVLNKHGGGGMGSSGTQGNVFSNVCLFSSSFKKVVNSYLLGLGRKGQKPRIGKKYGFFSPQQKEYAVGTVRSS